MNEIVKAAPYSLRAAAIIKRNGKVLLCKSSNHDVLYLVGGGIEPGESSAQAILRECFEETGLHFEIDRLIFVQERFYNAENVSHHEITFIYLMKDNSFPIPDGRNTDRNDEHLYWIETEKLDDLAIVPSFIKPALKKLPAELSHIIAYQ